MFKNSSELLDCALREFQAAIDSGNLEVKLIVREFGNGQTYNLQKIWKEFEIEDIIQLLREKFSGYDIKSCFKADSLDVPGVNTLPEMKYFAVWESVLIKEE